MNLGLRLKFLAIIIPAVIVGFILISAIWVWESYGLISDPIWKNSSDQARLVSRNIDTWLEKSTHIVNTIANDKDTVELMQGSESAKNRLEHRLKSHKKALGLRNLGILDANGISVAASNEGKDGVDYSKLTYVKETFQKNELVFSKPRKSRVDGVALLSIAEPIIHNSKTIGVAFASIPLSHFYDQYVRPYRTEKSDILYRVFTRDCTLLAHPDPTQVLSQEKSNACTTQNHFFKFNYNGHEYFAASEQTSNDWMVVVAYPERVIYENLFSKILWPVVYGSFMLLIIIGIVYKFVSTITNSIVSTVHIVDQLSFGTTVLDQESTSALVELRDRTDELGEIGKSADRLVSALLDRSKLVGEISEGNLKKSVGPLSEEDSLGQALDEMVDKLASLISMLMGLIDFASEGSKELERSNEELIQASEAEEQQLIQLNSFVSDIRESTSNNLKFVSDVDEQATSSYQKAQEGIEYMKHMVLSMETIALSGAELTSVMETINEVTDQTSLIALNATIEAARAKEHGKGFAVVADEIRLLSQRSAKATKSSQEHINSTLLKIEEGQKVVATTSEVFEHICQLIKNMSESAHKISEQSENQATLTTTIGDGINHLNTAMKKSQSKITLSHNTALKLKQEIIKLSEAIEYFSMPDSPLIRAKKNTP